jgi:hypothetical protein
MRFSKFAFLVLLTLPLASLLGPAGCEKKPSGDSARKDDHGHSHAPGDGHDHAETGDKDMGAGHGGPVLALGEQTIGSFLAVATRDEGAIVAGKDAPIDVTVTPASGSVAKVAAVRFWIGTQDAKGSVKAKASIEDPKSPDRWHTHVEIPSPLPADSRLWVEIEDDKRATSVGGFDLKK